MIEVAGDPGTSPRTPEADIKGDNGGKILVAQSGGRRSSGSIGGPERLFEPGW